MREPASDFPTAVSREAVVRALRELFGHDDESVYSILEVTFTPVRIEVTQTRRFGEEIRTTIAVRGELPDA